MGGYTFEVEPPATSTAGHLEEVVVLEGDGPIGDAACYGGDDCAARRHVDSRRQRPRREHHLDETCELRRNEVWVLRLVAIGTLVWRRGYAC